MKILRKNDNWNKINTREELLELLKKYNRILRGSMIHYLNGLVDRKSTRLNSSHWKQSRMPSSA